MRRQMTMIQRLVCQSVKRIYDFCGLNQNLKFFIRCQIMLFAEHELMQAYVIFLNNMQRVFFIYVDTVWENDVLLKFQKINES